MIPSSSCDGMDSNHMELGSYASRHAQKYQDRLKEEQQLAEQLEADATLARELQEAEEKRSSPDSAVARNIAHAMKQPPKPSLPLLAKGDDDDVRAPLRTGYMDRLIQDEFDGRESSRIAMLAWFPIQAPDQSSERLLPVMSSRDDGSSPLMNDRTGRPWRRRRELILKFLRDHWRSILIGVLFLMVLIHHSRSI